jgi:hypothetical protein
VLHGGEGIADRAVVLTAANPDASATIVCRIYSDALTLSPRRHRRVYSHGAIFMLTPELGARRNPLMAIPRNCCEAKTAAEKDCGGHYHGQGHVCKNHLHLGANCPNMLPFATWSAGERWPDLSENVTTATTGATSTTW